MASGPRATPSLGHDLISTGKRETLAVILGDGCLAYNVPSPRRALRALRSLQCRNVPLNDRENENGAAVFNRFVFGSCFSAARAAVAAGGRGGGRGGGDQAEVALAEELIDSRTHLAADSHLHAVALAGHVGAVGQTDHEFQAATARVTAENLW